VPPLAAEAGESIAPRRTQTIYATMSSVKTKSVQIERRLETIPRSLKKAMQAVTARMSAWHA
jgi:hypothetical protein